MPRPANDEGKKQAKALWRSGQKQVAIAAELDFNVRTIRRWLKDEPKPAHTAVTDPRADIPYPALLALVGGNSQAASHLLFALEMARMAGNSRLPSFLRLKVAEAQMVGDGKLEQRSEPWTSLIVGLPVLAEAMGVPALADITQAMSQHRPWEGRGRRRAYHDAARPLLRQMYHEAMGWSLRWGVGLVPDARRMAQTFNVDLQNVEGNNERVSFTGTVNGRQTAALVLRTAIPMKDTDIERALAMRDPGAWPPRAKEVLTEALVGAYKEQPDQLHALVELESYNPSEAEIQVQEKAEHEAVDKGRFVLLQSVNVTADIMQTLPGKVLDLLSTFPDVDKQRGRVSGRKVDAFAALISILAEFHPSIEGQAT